MAQTVSNVSYSAKNKQKARRSRKLKAYYTHQFDVTRINKVITLATHISLFNDRKSLDRLKQVVAIDRLQARRKATLRGNKRALDALILAG